MFLQLSQSVIQVSIVGFIAAEAFVNQNYPRLIQYAFYMLMNFPTFLLYCWMADIVQQTSESLGDIVYSTEWTRRDPKIARNLMLIILYSRVPLKLTAGKFFVLDLSFFREYVFTSTSYLSVLVNIKLRQ
ncbi:odorant receptor 22c-like [Diachasmimorpha longicaudata]|uniref:odorant receptor 22c-like n=1 Tax=Diachasmimorpha longicaudata TaxID=58733 RepID=UPI0030B8F88B